LMVIVDIEHVVSTNVADAAAGWPCIRARVAKSPGLNKALVRKQSRPIGHRVFDEVSLQLGRLNLYSRFADGSFAAGTHNRMVSDRGERRHGQSRRLDLLVDRLAKEIFDLDLLLARSHRWLGRLDIGNSLNLGGDCWWRRHERLGLGAGDWARSARNLLINGLVTNKSGDAAATYRSAELEQRVSSVVLKIRGSLAVCTEVNVRADSTLEANSSDEGFLVFAERTVAVDRSMSRRALEHIEGRDRLIDWRKAVVWMSSLGHLHALGTVVPVGASQALVTNAIDGLSM